LDTYIQQQARQDLDRRLANVFILTEDGKRIAGFYTLSALSLLPETLPDAARAKLPRLPLPVTLLGRMAVDEVYRGRGLGEFVLLHALSRALRSSVEVASWAVIVDAKIGARTFYLKNGFIPLPDQPDRLYLPMKDVGKTLG
jgi:GNAT superfamily N-acetyltransferase